jgi:hypothetical protein
MGYSFGPSELLHNSVLVRTENTNADIACRRKNNKRHGFKGNNEINPLVFENSEKDCPLSFREMILQDENAMKRRPI